MNNLTKITAAAAVVISTGGSAIAHADIVNFSYGVSSATVTTILSVVTTETEPAVGGSETLHFSYRYKSGASATDNSAACEEVDFTWSASPNDLIAVSPDGFFGSTTQGILFNDPAFFAFYEPSHVSLALLQGITKPMRFVTFVDNNDGLVANDNTLTAGRATIIETLTGAAWSYRGYNPRGNSFTGAGVGADPLGGFSERFEVFGEVIGPGNGPGHSGTREDGVNVSIRPFSEFASIFFVQPIAHFGNTNSRGTRVLANQDRTNLESLVTISVSDYTGRPGDAMFDRDENPVSSNVERPITCVGAVSLRDLLSLGAQLLLEDTGGWGEFKTVRMKRAGVKRAGKRRSRGTPASAGRVRTDEVVALFLEHNDTTGAGVGGTVDGQLVGGIFNNGYELRED